MEDSGTPSCWSCEQRSKQTNNGRSVSYYISLSKILYKKLYQPMLGHDCSLTRLQVVWIFHIIFTKQIYHIIRIHGAFI